MSWWRWKAPKTKQNKKKETKSKKKRKSFSPIKFMKIYQTETKWNAITFFFCFSFSAIFSFVEEFFFSLFRIYIAHLGEIAMIRILLCDLRKFEPTHTYVRTEIRSKTTSKEGKKRRKIKQFPRKKKVYLQLAVNTLSISWVWW